MIRRERRFSGMQENHMLVEELPGMVEKTTSGVHVPAYDDMLWPTIIALKALGGSGTIQEIESKVADVAGYTNEQLAVPHGNNDRSEISYRLAWSRTYLKAVGAIDNSGRGVWAITDEGRSLTEADMASVLVSVQQILGRQRRGNRKRKPANDLETVDAVEPVAFTDEEKSAPHSFSSTRPEEWTDRLLSVLQAMPPASFERLCQRVLRESGFTKVEVTGRSGDGGIDGIGVLRIALLSFQVFFQCKRYRGSVGAAAIRDFRGAMVGRTDKGLLITTGNFTPDAMREATRDGAPVLDLIDGGDLCLLLKDLKLGVSTRQVEEVTVEADWFASL